MKLLAWYLALVSLVGIAVGLGGAGGDPSAPVPDRSGRFVLPDVELASAASLHGFADCDELLGYFRQQAPLAGRRTVEFDDAGEMAEEESATEGVAADSPTAAPVAEQEATADGFSGTNVQEVDVDEPDIVKTDGDLIVAIAGTELHVVDPDGPRLLGVVALPGSGSSELLLTGDRATVLTRSDGAVRVGGGSVQDASTSMPVQQGSLTIVTTVDLGDPGAPRVVETATFDGDYVSARMTGTLARIVLRSVPLVPPGELDTAGVEAWLPSDEDGPIVACDAVARPAEPAGVGTVTVLTVDVAASLTPVDATAVVADVETVYASTDRLYVATTDGGVGCCWIDEPIPVEPDGGIGDTVGGGFVPGEPTPLPQPEPISTDVHAFDTTGAATPYLGSGRVEGRLLNSFALSEHEGTLRVATTVESFDGSRPTMSAVITLDEEAGGLVERGRLAGLGTSEQIYAVRYQGDVAYVVTFRRTDPLYTLDLSDPAEPRLEAQRIGERSCDQRFRQSVSLAVSKKATARAN